jgi:WD40 repeat protein
MENTSVGQKIDASTFQGVVAKKVIIENLFLGATALPTHPGGEVDDGMAPCPYPGLANFGPEDSALFFGRERAIEWLAVEVVRQPLTALVGASGSGKSSVVLAGLAPRLAARGGWRFSHFRIATEPDKNPFTAIARALVPLLSDADAVERLEQVEALAARLESGTVRLPNALGACRSQNPGKRILLIADQFEELFTSVDDEPQRWRFVDMLLAGFPLSAAVDPPNICLILTLRADFYGMALRHRPLADALQGHVENLGPMTRDELREAMIRPADKAITFENGLIETLLDDVEKRPGSLPLLQFALREMWTRQEHGRISRASYDAIGGVEGALAARAQAIFEELTSRGADGPQALLFRRLFTRLVTLGEGAEDTRRVVDRQELGAEAWALAQRLANADNRLVVTSASAAGRETVEVAHEALIRNWPTLAEWTSRDRAFQSWLRQLALRIKEWRDHPEDDGALLRGSALAVAEDWLGKRWDELSDQEKTYIAASAALRDAMRHREEEARAAELRQQHELAETATKLARARRRQALVAGVFSVVAILMAIAAGYAAKQARDANHVAIANESRALAALSAGALQTGNPHNALKLALAAWPRSASDPRPRLRRTVEALSLAMAQPLALSPDMKHDGPVRGAVFDKADARILSWSDDDTLRVWDAATGRPIGEPMRHNGSVLGAVFDKSGERILSWSEDDTLRLWDAVTGQPIGEPMRHRGVRGAVFDKAESRILSWSEDSNFPSRSGDNTIRLWDAATGQPIGEPMQHEGSVQRAVFDESEAHILSWSNVDHTIRRWDTATVQPIGPIWHGVDGAVFDKARARILSWGDETLRLWDAVTGQPIGDPMRHDLLVLGAVFDNSKSRILSWSIDKTLRLWDAATGRPMGEPMRHDGWINGAVFDNSESRILSWSDDKTLRLWDAATGQPIGAPMRHDGKVRGAVFDEAGARILSWSDDDTLRLWDAATNQPIGAPMHQDGVVAGAVFDNSESRILSWSKDINTIELWDAATDQPIGEPMQHDGPVWGVVFDKSGERILSWSYDKTLRLWDTRTGQPIGMLMRHDGSVSGAVFNKSGARILSWSDDETLRLWDATTGQPIGEPMQHEDEVSGAIFDNSESRILSWGGETLRLWDLATGQPIGAPMRHDGKVRGAVFDKADARILSWSDDKMLHLWDASTGQPIGAPMGHDGQVSGAVFDRSQSRILSWSEEDKTLGLWGAATGQPIGEPMRHDDKVLGAVFDKAGARILSWSEDKTLRLWDAATGQPIGVPMHHDGAVWGAVFDNSESRILSWSEDKTLRLWDAATGQPIGAPMRHDGSFLAGVGGAVFDKSELRVLSWSNTTLRLWNIKRLRSRNLAELACRLLADKDISTLRTDFGINVADPICANGAEGIPAPDSRDLQD